MEQSNNKNTRMAVIAVVGLASLLLIAGISWWLISNNSNKDSSPNQSTTSESEDDEEQKPDDQDESDGSEDVADLTTGGGLDDLFSSLSIASPGTESIASFASQATGNPLANQLTNPSSPNSTLTSSTTENNSLQQLDQFSKATLLAEFDAQMATLEAKNLPGITSENANVQKYYKHLDTWFKGANFSELTTLMDRTNTLMNDFNTTWQSSLSTDGTCTLDSLTTLSNSPALATFTQQTEQLEKDMEAWEAAYNTEFAAVKAETNNFTSADWKKAAEYASLSNKDELRALISKMGDMLETVKSLLNSLQSCLASLGGSTTTPSEGENPGTNSSGT